MCVWINECVHIVNQTGGGFNCDNINIFIASCLCIRIWWIQGLYNADTWTHTQWLICHSDSADMQERLLHSVLTSTTCTLVHTNYMYIHVCVCVCIYMYMYSIDQTCFTGLYHTRPLITYSHTHTHTEKTTRGREIVKKWAKILIKLIHASLQYMYIYISNKIVPYNSVIQTSNSYIIYSIIYNQYMNTWY